VSRLGDASDLPAVVRADEVAESSRADVAPGQGDALPAGRSLQIARLEGARNQVLNFKVKSGPEEGATLFVAYLDDYFPTVIWRHVPRDVSQGTGCLGTSGLDAWKFYATLIRDERAAVHCVEEIAGHWLCPLRGNLLPKRGNLPAVAPDAMQNGRCPSVLLISARKSAAEQVQGRGLRVGALCFPCPRSFVGCMRASGPFCSFCQSRADNCEETLGCFTLAEPDLLKVLVGR
jgi:hypothetical protein